MNTYDAVIIGGGIHGCSVAFNLAQDNLKVLVLEKDYCGKHASGVNAGGVRRLGRDFREIELLNFSMEKYWHNIENFLDDDCEFRKSSQIKIATTLEDLNFLRTRVEAVKKMGFHHEELILHDELKEILPELSDEALGAILVKGDGCANPFKTTNAIKRKALRHHVVVKEQEVVVDIKGNDIASWRVTTDKNCYTTKYIINCAGAWGNQIAYFFGENIPFNASCYLLSITSKAKFFLKPVIGFQGRSLSLKQFDNGSFMIGGGFKGTLNLKSNKTVPDFRGIAQNIKNACDLFKKMKEVTILRSWGGIEGECADKIPIISKSTRFESVIHNFGYSGHGFELAFGSGKIVSEMLLGQKLSIGNVDSFKIDRF